MPDEATITREWIEAKRQYLIGELRRLDGAMAFLDMIEEELFPKAAVEEATDGTA